MKIRYVLVAAVLLATIGLSSCDWFWLPDVITLGFAPLASAVHTMVTVVGQGFGVAPGDITVTFDGVEAHIVMWSDTNILVRVPVVPTPAGPRTVTVQVLQGGSLVGTGSFTVLRGVLFETNRAGNSEIYVMNPDGSQQTNLTNDPDDDYHPVWSPDGTEIAFVSYRDGNSEVYSMGADGSNQTNLTSHPNSDFFPVWSPAGTRIAFMTDREAAGPVVLYAAPKIIIEFNSEIFVTNADGTGQTNLTDDSADTVDALMEAIVDRYFKVDCAVFTPNPDRLGHIEEMVNTYKADGVIHYGLQFCQPYLMESIPVEKALEEKSIPTLRIETDYGMEDVGQLTTRIEAFIEQLR